MPFDEVFQHHLIERGAHIDDPIRVGLLIISILGNPPAKVDHEIRLDILLSSPRWWKRSHATNCIASRLRYSEDTLLNESLLKQRGEVD